MEEYSNEAHLPAVMAAIQYFEKIHDTDEFFPDFEGKDDESVPLLQNPTKTPIILKDFLRALPAVQLYTGCLKCATTLNFVFVHVQVIPDHGGKKEYLN